MTLTLDYTIVIGNHLSISKPGIRTSISQLAPRPSFMDDALGLATPKLQQLLRHHRTFATRFF